MHHATSKESSSQRYPAQATLLPCATAYQEAVTVQQQPTDATLPIEQTQLNTPNIHSPALCCRHTRCTLHKKRAPTACTCRLDHHNAAPQTYMPTSCTHHPPVHVERVLQLLAQCPHLGALLQQLPAKAGNLAASHRRSSSSSRDSAASSVSSRLIHIDMRIVRRMHRHAKQFRGRHEGEGASGWKLPSCLLFAAHSAANHTATFIVGSQTDPWPCCTAGCPHPSPLA